MTQFTFDFTEPVQAAPFTGLDFSVITNPYGPNPVLLQAIRDADHTSLPGAHYRRAREKVAAWHGTQPEHVALGVGTGDLLWRLCRAFLPVTGELLSLHAPPAELTRAVAGQYAHLRTVAEVPSSLPEPTRMVYVGHPHNPTGAALPAAQLHGLAEMCAVRGALLILDETYAPFTTVGTPPRHNSIVRILSAGEAHGLLGAQPAYAVAALDIVDRLNDQATRQHVPAGTAAVLEHLPEGASFLAQTMKHVQHHAAELAANLAALGRVEHHGTPYMTLRVPDAAQVSAHLLERGLKVRDCASYGLPTTIRMATRMPGENNTLVRTLRELLGKGGRHG